MISKTTLLNICSDDIPHNGTISNNDFKIFQKWLYSRAVSKVNGPVDLTGKIYFCELFLYHGNFLFQLLKTE